MIDTTMPSTPSTATNTLTLRAQSLVIWGRLPKHWRGELPMWEALTHCIALVFLPAVFAFAVALGVMSVSFESRIPARVFYIGYGLTLLAIGWWCKGMFALSNQLLSQQRMLAALVAFLLPCPVAWNLVSTWSVDFWKGASELVELPHRQGSLQAFRTKRPPVTVTAMPELHRLSLKGSIGWDSSKVLASAIAANPAIHLIELDSPGGLVDETNVMVDLIQKHGMDTLVLETCASACTELFVSGRRRFVGPKARFMFHQSGYEGRPKNAVWDIPEYESSILLRAQGVAQNFADAALNEPNHGAWWPHVVDVKRSGFATHWWSDRPAEYN